MDKTELRTIQTSVVEKEKIEYFFSINDEGLMVFHEAPKTLEELNSYTLDIVPHCYEKPTFQNTSLPNTPFLYFYIICAVVAMGMLLLCKLAKN
jgi:hypothetical protein